MNERTPIKHVSKKSDEPTWLLNALIKQVPTDLFVRMVNNASLPPDDSRALIAAFKANKK